jgi:hypothetical protein
MAKDKYDFISEILTEKKMSPAQREKILILAAQEIKNEKVNDLELKDRIAKIENFLKINLNTSGENGDPEREPKSPSNRSLPREYTDPTELSRFLLAYNQNRILKTTCHEIDKDELSNILEVTGEQTYNFEDHYREIIKAFEELENNFKKVDYKLRGLIRGYLTGQNKKKEPVSWASTITVNWNSSELHNWALNNPGVPPNPDESLSEELENLGFEFPEIKKLGIKTFTGLVIHFKKLFHIRRDNSLKDIIIKVNQEKKWDEKIDFEILEGSFRSNLEFFTDIDKLKQAYNDIVKIIVEAARDYKLDKPIVKLSLLEVDNSIVFSIHHLNTSFSKTPQNLIDKIGQKHTNLIYNQINGMCDLYIQADFENNEYAKINLWNNKVREVIKLDSFKGVEHQLVFRK